MLFYAFSNQNLVDKLKQLVSVATSRTNFIALLPVVRELRRQNKISQPPEAGSIQQNLKLCNLQFFPSKV